MHLYEQEFKQIVISELTLDQILIYISSPKYILQFSSHILISCSHLNIPVKAITLRECTVDHIKRKLSRRLRNHALLIENFLRLYAGQIRERVTDETSLTWLTRLM